MNAEPTMAGLAGAAPWPTGRRLLLATRPGFLTASALPVVLGTCSGFAAAGRLDPVAFLLALAAVALLHAAANVTNDVYDDLLGTDRINTGRIFPYTGGSRVIQNGIMNRRQMGVYAITLFAAAALLGGVLLYLKGMGVALFGLAGTVIFVAYSAPPIRLSGRGLGEPAVGIAFGILPVLGAHWLQTGTVSPAPLLLSLPVAFWITNVLLINEVPDLPADARTGKHTLAVRLGPRGAGRLYMVLHGAAPLAVVLAVSLGTLHWGALAGPLALALLAVPASRILADDNSPPRAMRRAIKTTLGIHAIGSLWLSLWVVLPSFLSV